MKMKRIRETQNIGMLNAYAAHLNTDIFACAALLAGGAGAVLGESGSL
jgi:hypothetical protein